MLKINFDLFNVIRGQSSVTLVNVCVIFVNVVVSYGPELESSVHFRHRKVISMIKEYTAGLDAGL